MANSETAKLGDGPFLDAAFFCESVIQEDRSFGGLLSIVRIVDFVGVPSRAVPGGHEATDDVRCYLVLRVRRGKAAPERRLKVALESPTGARTPVTTEILFSRESTTTETLPMPIGFMPPTSGVFWFEVSIDGVPLARLPLLVEFGEDLSRFERRR